MLKYLFGLIGFGVLIRILVAPVFHHDPTDDFSFWISEASNVEAHALMSEESVRHVFEDRLRDFPSAELPKLARKLLELCNEYRFDPAFILSLIQVESGFKAGVISPSGAVGLMQLMPETASLVARDFAPAYPRKSRQPLVSAEDLKNPFLNMSLGVAYMAFLRERYEQYTPYFTVAAYNIGPAKMDQLLLQKSFKPVKTRKYFEDIRRQVNDFRFYRKQQAQAGKVRDSKRS